MDAARLVNAVRTGGADAVDAELASAYPQRAESLRPAAQAALDRGDWDALSLLASHLATRRPNAGEVSAAPGSLAAIAEDPYAVVGIDKQLDELGAEYPCVVQKCPSCPAGSFMGHVQFTVPKRGGADSEFALAVAPRVVSDGELAGRVAVGKVVRAGRTVPMRGQQVALYSVIFDFLEPDELEDGDF